MSASEQPKDDAERESEEAKGGRRTRHPSDDLYEEPLFLKDRSDGRKGDAQDEKDETVE